LKRLVIHSHANIKDKRDKFLIKIQLTLWENNGASSLLSEVCGIGLEGSLRLAEGSSTSLVQVTASLRLIVSIEVANTWLGGCL
jgi:hypothetical protein